MTWALFGLVLAVFCGVSWQMGPLICDDAYITLSHAQHFLVSGELLASTLNPVDAATSPLYVLVLAGFGWIFGVEQLENVAFGLGILGSLTSLIVLFVLGRQVGLPPFAASALMAAWAISHSLYATGLSGMETPLYIAAILLGYAIWMHGEGHARLYRSLYAIVFLMALWRPEGFLFALALSLGEIWRGANHQVGAMPAGFRKVLRKVVGFLVAGCLGTVAYFVLHLWAWGHFLPESVLAKQAGSRILGWAALQNWYSQLFLKGPMLGGMRTLTVLWCIAIFFAAMAAIKSVKSSGSARSHFQLFPIEILIWPGLYFCLYFFSGASHGEFSWYFTPVMPFLLLAMALAWQRIGLTAAIFSRHLWALTLLILATGIWNFHRLGIAEKSHRAQTFRELRYAQATQYLNDQNSKGSVLMDEVGFFAYRGQFRILDFHGLLSPEVLRDVKAFPKHGPRLISLVNHFAPEWVAWTVWIQKGSDTTYGEYAFLQKQYRLQKTFTNPQAPHVLQVWKRK